MLDDSVHPKVSVCNERYPFDVGAVREREQNVETEQTLG